MQRTAAMSLMLGATWFLAGCLGDGVYEPRIDSYVETLNAIGKRDTYLNAAEAGPYSAVGVSIRLPKPMAASAAPFLQVQPGQFDLAQFYTDSANSGVQMAVIARLKNPPAPPEGQQAAPRDGTPFPQAVAALLGQGAPPVTEGSNQGGVPYKRFVLNDQPDNPNPLYQTYLFERGNHDVAIIVLVPRTAANAPIIANDLPLALGSLQVN